MQQDQYEHVDDSINLLDSEWFEQHSGEHKQSEQYIKFESN